MQCAKKIYYMILLLLLPNIKNYLEIFFLPPWFFKKKEHANITRWKRAPKMFQFIAQVCFFITLISFCQSMRVYPSSVIKFECKYLLLLLCTAGQTKTKFVKKLISREKIILFTQQHLNCVETILYISLLSLLFYW